MRIFYFFSSYISHLCAGLDYFECLRALGHEVRANLSASDEAALGAASGWPEVLPAPLTERELGREQLDFAASADLVILHDDPLRYPALFAALPFLSGRRVAAYAAWENELLSPHYVSPLQMASEVWSCSDFSCKAIAPHVKTCRLLPHLVRRVPPAAADLRWAEETLARRGDEFIFLSVVDGINPRKNLQGLLAAYAMLRAQTKTRVRLVIKQYRLDLVLEGIGSRKEAGGLEGVSSIADKLSQGRMAALYAFCDAYASPHHAEGWGLGLSSAMAYGKPVIATGYSGNMQFMDDSNSLPVAYCMAPVSERMRELIPLFTPEMRWAEPDLPAFAAAMRRAAERRLPAALYGNAAGIARRFGPERIMERLAELL